MEVNLKDLPKNINRAYFWSYKEDANLPVEIVIEQVLIYGDIDEIKTLVEFLNDADSDKECL